MDRSQGPLRQGACFIDRFADNVDDASKIGLANRNGDRQSGILDVLPAHQALG